MNWEALSGALAYLTVLPTRRLRDQPGRMFAWFPAVGLVIGCLLAALAANDALPRAIVSLTVVVGWILITGGLQLNGLGNTFDGVFWPASFERRWELMHGPRSGFAAVFGLVGALLAKWILVQDITPFLLIVPAVLGRWAMTLAAYAFPLRQRTENGDITRGLTRRDVLTASALAVMFISPSMLLNASGAGLAFVLTPVVVLVFGHWSVARLGGGLTPDVYGALCEITEVICLYCLVT